MNAVGRCLAGWFSEYDVDGGDVLHFVRSIFFYQDGVSQLWLWTDGRWGDGEASEVEGQSLVQFKYIISW